MAPSTTSIILHLLADIWNSFSVNRLDIKHLQWKCLVGVTHDWCYFALKHNYSINQESVWWYEKGSDLRFGSLRKVQKRQEVEARKGGLGWRKTWRVRGGRTQKGKTGLPKRNVSDFDTLPRQSLFFFSSHGPVQMCVELSGPAQRATCAALLNCHLWTPERTPAHWMSQVCNPGFLFLEHSLITVLLN